VTVVPTAFQLASWIPAWWRGSVGADDLLAITGGVDLPALSRLAGATAGVTAYCPRLGVGVLPGPKRVTEAAVHAGEAVILAGRPAEASAMLVPGDAGWDIVPAGPSRPAHTGLRQADAEMAQAVIAAEREIRECGLSVATAPAPASLRPLPPDAPAASRGVLARAVRLWTAVEAVQPALRTAALEDVATKAAWAALTAYCPPLAQRSRGAVDRDVRFA
jgi:hypothetical protein